MLCKGHLIPKFMYIQLFNYCLSKASCHKCTFKTKTYPCTLFSGVFEELKHSNATNMFISLQQAVYVHRFYSCEQCVMKKSMKGFILKDSCGMIKLSERLFLGGIKRGKQTP